MDIIGKIVELLKQLPPEMLEGKIKIVEIEEDGQKISPKVQKLLNLYEMLDDAEKQQFCELIDKGKQIY
ncbi:MAG: hypothetical protein NZZ41_06700 [Candidatus Dojkabacteria bacterium]|nr:hypothetical protein [Candidatus Dojkabacteria bacterium]